MGSEMRDSVVTAASPVHIKKEPCDPSEEAMDCEEGQRLKIVEDRQREEDEESRRSPRVGVLDLAERKPEQMITLKQHLMIGRTALHRESALEEVAQRSGSKSGSRGDDTQSREDAMRDDLNERLQQQEATHNGHAEDEEAERTRREQDLEDTLAVKDQKLEQLVGQLGTLREQLLAQQAEAAALQRSQVQRQQRQMELQRMQQDMLQRQQQQLMEQHHKINILMQVRNLVKHPFMQ